MGEARDHSCAVKLNDGRILVTGGVGVSGDLSSTEFYLPEGSFMPGPVMNASRSSHTCTLLNDGRVLVGGGDTDGAGSSEVLDSAGGEWQLVGATGNGRRGHTATLLSDGKVLLAGGADANGPLDSIEIFDPESSTLISSDPALFEARSQHAAVLLADGRVMLVGGNGENGSLASTEIFDPKDFSVVAGPKLSTARAGHSAVRLDDGRVLVAGGSDGSKELDSAEMLDAAATAWSTLAAHLSTARRDHLAILIPGNGGVLIAGGLQGGQPLGATELYLPIENTFLSLGALTLARYGMAAAPIDAGVILAAGGRTADGPQSACGVLTVPAIHFAKTLYHIPETAAATFSSFPVSAKVNLSLAVGNVTVNDRLLTSSATVAANSTQTVPIVLTRLQDAGSTVRLTATAANTISAVATTQVHNATALTLSLPQSTYEGLNANILALLSRGAAVGSMTGTLDLGVATLPDGTSNTIIIGETLNSTATSVNTTGSAVSVQKPLTNLKPGTVQVTASYSGDGGNDPARASGNFSVISRTPVLQLATSTANVQAGVPFNVTATVGTSGTVSPSQPFTGSISLFQSGFPIAGVTGLATPGSLFSSVSVTPLTLDTMSFSATFSGDSFFRSVSSQPLTILVQRAPTTLTLNSAPSTYTCGQASSFSVTLAYPVALGLTNRTVGLTVLAGDGSVRTIAPSGTAALVVLPPGPKDLSAKATATLQAVLPLDNAGVQATFGGDILLSLANSAVVHPALQPSAVDVQLLAKGPGPLTNPVQLTAQVHAASCSTPPTGTLEFQDNGATLGVATLQSPQTLPFQEFGFNSSSTSIGTLTVSRPAGTHNIVIRYSGDAHYLPATSATVALVFQ
jgi:hypothetical protein